ncbi:protein kinase C-binding protein 1-like isoform X1 [Vespula squamosa]|uniref:Protein kinase C-binding protein 1-like isoform X1 n=1 Tax=Vespula squamosa TaxID=30214 RepID=A0ABD2AJT7_VESSQ
MAETSTENTAKIRKVVDAEETINANAMCLMNKEAKSNEEVPGQISSLEKNDNNEKSSNSTDAFPSPTKCSEDITLKNTKDNSCIPCSANDNTLKIDKSTNEVSDVKDIEDIVQEKNQENSSENENSNIVMVSEELEGSNEGTKADCEDKKHKEAEQTTNRLESLMTDANEEKVLENVEIKKEINKDNFNTDDELSMEEETRELKKESIEKKTSTKIDEELEVGIVGPPTAVSDLINEEELHGESALSAEEKVQDHVAEWVQKSVATEVLITGEIEEEENEIPGNCRRRRRNLRDRRSRKRENEDLPSLSTRKSQRIVSNIIKRSIKCESNLGKFLMQQFCIIPQSLLIPREEERSKSKLEMRHAKTDIGSIRTVTKIRFPEDE